MVVSMILVSSMFSSVMMNLLVNTHHFSYLGSA